MTNLTNDAKRHIETLTRHGAAIKAPDGSLTGLTEEFCQQVVVSCGRGGFNAITYDLILPGIEDGLMLAVWRDGHVNSGSIKSICGVLDR